MKRYRCGCEVVPYGQEIPGIDPKHSIEYSGWFHQENKPDGHHYVRPCGKHEQHVVSRWAARMMMAARASHRTPN